MKLEGTTATFPLRELIDMITYSSVTGSLNIHGQDERGQLYFRDGQLYHVGYSHQIGIEALAAILALAEVRFAFESNTLSPEESVWGDINDHLRSAERLAERWRQVRPYVSDLDLTPLLTVPREAAQSRANPSTYPLLNLVDGTSSLRQCATTLGWAEIDTAETAAQLILDGVIELGRPLKQAPAVVADQGGGGIFDRIRARACAVLPLPGPALVPAAAQASPMSGGEEAILRLLQS